MARQAPLFAVPLCLVAALAACSGPLGQPTPPVTSVSPSTAPSASTAPVAALVSTPEELAKDAADEATEHLPIAHPTDGTPIRHEEFYDHVEHGFDVERYVAIGGLDDDADGHQEVLATAEVEVAGQGEHTVSLAHEDAPVMSEHVDTLTVTDHDAGNVRTIEFDQDGTQMVLKEGAETVKVEFNPDGTALVNGQPAPTSADAARLLAATPVLDDMSRHSLAFLYARLKRQPVEETRAPIILIPIVMPILGDLINPKPKPPVFNPGPAPTPYSPPSWLPGSGS